MVNNDGSLLMEDARLLFRNFAGKEDKYNKEGDRNFCVVLDDAVAEQMIEDGWNVKYLRARDETETPTPYLQVSVGFKVRPPRIVVVTSKGRTDVGQHELEILDWLDIAKADLIIRPYNWAVNGKSGVKAYLKTLFVTVAEDYLEQQYADVPEIGRGSEPLAIEAGSQGASDDLDIVDAELVD